MDIYKLSQKEAEKNQKIESLENEKKKLKDKLSYVNSDEFVEKEARTKLNMKKENEQVYVVNNGSSSLNSGFKDESNNSNNKSKKSTISKWMELIF